MSEETPATETEITKISTKNVTFGDRYLRNRPFLVINAIARPTDKANTSVQGWNVVEGNWNVYERASIYDRVSDKMLREATIVIDILNNKVVKNRFADQSTDEQVLQHFISKYGKEITKGLEAWGRSTAPVPRVNIDTDATKESE